MPTSPLYYPPFLSTHTLITVAAQCSQNKGRYIINSETSDNNLHSQRWLKYEWPSV